MARDPGQWEGSGSLLPRIYDASAFLLTQARIYMPYSIYLTYLLTLPSTYYLPTYLTYLLLLLSNLPSSTTPMFLLLGAALMGSSISRRKAHQTNYHELD